jgi:hypothetical protein
MGALLALFALLLVPFILLGVAFKVLFGLMLLPFRVIGGVFHAFFGLLAGLFGLAAGGIGLLFGLVAAVVVLVLLPLAPLLLLGGIVWLALKAFTPATRAV